MSHTFDVHTHTVQQQHAMGYCTLTHDTHMLTTTLIQSHTLTLAALRLAFVFVHTQFLDYSHRDTLTYTH